MKSLDVLSDQVGSLPTQTVQARAHGFHAIGSGFGHGHATSVPTEGLVSNPSALSTCGCNPNARLALRVNDGQSPFSFKVLDVAVGDHFARQGIDHLNGFLSKNHLWSYPDQVDNAGADETDHQFEERLQEIVDDNKTVGSKKNDQYKSYARPNEIGFGTKGFIHAPIMAGDIK